ncbi:hypothetical protein UFOVP247_23 [uncultured Caudovirales phage]|uniref:Uncharacterized protein n=1 Tax=uncultured Caudovirales phage TaxID=2100421 RepID=A0A6J7WV36_9CAUD|nr:hypothetical protein UFOVP247_23 [uncultured Caudovirales phage]
MAYITTTVDVDVEVYLEEFEDDDLVDELKSRGYEVYEKNDPNKGNHPVEVRDLYNTYNTCSPELFEKELKRFFRESLDVNIY